MGEAREWVLTAVVGVAMLWKLLCVWLRSRRNKLLLSFSPIEDAVTVRTLMANVEFPFVCHLSLEFALFRTYAIPSISSILAKSGKFDSDAVKRADDTEILIREFQSHHVDSDRGSAALRRLNYIHSQYPIKNGDYLYVLGLFILEPMRWIHQYGFRDMTTAEKLANFVSWRDIGIRMGIKDIPEDLEVCFSQTLSLHFEHGRH
ncbi:ER-bound oxygenase mpaB isoform X1 [Physcomitrium patens]|uniref:ER-bound oxygenase mpaB isoform X1 n=1 Tax=Physcomitrium patens TaxID=3218 RepID=UPI000D17473C|nr:mycophenolic acid synthesis protein B-like isoform X1 [Physcomitrium patens]|eukprot:XP_024404141.1 mycophenolic acid synthesis protein B-like isoform X1 [Physcomitrella patens]